MFEGTPSPRRLFPAGPSPRRARRWATFGIVATCVLVLSACGNRNGHGAGAGGAKDSPTAVDDAARAAAEAERVKNEALDRDWPLHALVTGLQITVHKDADPASMVIGWLRVGARVRAKGEPVKTPTCNTGWYALNPLGFVCAGEGVLVDKTPPKAEFEQKPPARDSALPYEYWLVKDSMVPEFNRLPSRDEQRAAIAYVDQYNAYAKKNPKLADKFLAGEIPGQATKPAVVHRLLQRGYFIAAAGTEERAFRKFTRTVRGRYIKQSQLEPRSAPAFHGVELTDAVHLPVVWAVRAARPMIRRDKADGTVRFVDDAEAQVVARLAVVTGWQRRENVAGTNYHVLATPAGDRYVKDWFFTIAEPTDKPREVKKDEPWVHVDISSQTLVLYEGPTPKFATLISSGMKDFDTPPGLYTVRRKYIADTMSNIGDTMDNRYSIDDVPWTQYFEGSFALHGAFWHSGFGLVHSHGCVNLAPLDAHRVWSTTWPEVPDGWLGVVADLTPFPESHVLITP